MASSGIIKSWVVPSGYTTSDGNSYAGAYFSFEWTATKKSAGVTTVSWSLYGKGRSSSPTWLNNSCVVTCTANGTTSTLYSLGWQVNQSFGDGTNTSFYASSDKSLRDSGSFDVTHSSDGSGSFTINMTVAIYTSTTHATSSTATLDANYPNITITYNANGGSGAPSSQSVAYDTSSTLSSTKPTRNGYTFLGWSTSSSATSATYSAGGTIKLTADTTLYAVWSATQYTLTYAPNGGTLSSTSQTYYITTSLSLKSAPTRTGYTFNNWKVTSASGNWTSGTTYGSGASVGTGKYGNSTLTAQWSATKYTITYNLNGGTLGGSTSNQTQDYYITDSLTLKDAPSRAGYSFSGWKVTTAAGSWASSSTYSAEKNMSTGNYGSITLTAQWSAIQYTITYNANGGTLSSTSQTYYITTSLTLKAAPTRTGYTFSGWKVTSASGGWTSGSSYAASKSMSTGNYGDITLTAQWTAWTYTVQYNANKSLATTVKTSSHSYEDGSYLTQSPFSVSGYTFLGWATSSTATTVTYQNGALAPYQLVSSDGETIALYAVWSQDTPWKLCQARIYAKNKSSKYVWHTL